MKVRDLLDDMATGLDVLETALRAAIVNQNIADVIHSATAKLRQASQHADAEIDTTGLDLSSLAKAADAFAGHPGMPGGAPLPFDNPNSNSAQGGG